MYRLQSHCCLVLYLSVNLVDISINYANVRSMHKSSEHTVNLECTARPMTVQFAQANVSLNYKHHDQYT